MIYKIQWHEDAIKDLQKIDRQTRQKIVTRVKDYLSRDPLALGKQLQGMFKGLYRYRYGSYRIIYAMDRESVLVLILRIAQRRDVYNSPISEN